MRDITVPFNANKRTKSDFDLDNVSTIITRIKILIAE